MELLNQEALREALERVPDWSITEDGLTRRFRFGSFVEAIAFVDRCAEIAEVLGHHPDIDIRYDVVMVAVTTHDSGGITQLDFRLASHLDQVAHSA